MSSGVKYEILISDPGGRFSKKSLGFHYDKEAAIEDAEHYTKMGLQVHLRDLEKNKFIKIK